MIRVIQQGVIRFFHGAISILLFGFGVWSNMFPIATNGWEVLPVFGARQNLEGQ
jgi:hypothetical protein